MSETLQFIYDATGPSIAFAVTPTNADGHVTTGTPPSKTMSILELEAKRPDLYIHLMSLIAAEPFFREEATAPVKDPDAVQAQANANARETERLRIANAESDRLRADAESAAAAAEEQRMAREEESRKLDSKLEAARAELADIEAAKSSKQPETNPETKESAK